MDKLKDRYEPSLSDLHNMQGFSVNFLRIKITESLVSHSQSGAMYQVLTVDVLENVEVF
jgi:hypothetical protein